MDTATLQLLTEGARALRVELSQAALDRFIRYVRLLERWNARINLTRIESARDVVAKHFLDSLAIVPHLGEALRMVDVGAGAGFPGVPIAIVRDDLQVTLVESIQKKAAFLEALKRELALPLQVLPVRADRISGTFDVAVSRATFDPVEWVEQGARLVAPAGLLIAMLGRDRPILGAPAGFSGPDLLPYSLPVEGERALALFRRAAIQSLG